MTTYRAVAYLATDEFDFRCRLTHQGLLSKGPVHEPSTSDEEFELDCQTLTVNISYKSLSV